MYTFTKYVFGVLLVAASMFTQAQTVVFSENFNASTNLPAGWQVVDNDGLTNNPTFVTNWGNAIAGWEISQYSTGNNAAFSTSWYDPAGTSDDWIITPAITVPSANTVLNWKAEALDTDFPDGYEVRVANAATVNAFMATSPIFTIAGEADALTSHSVSLSAFSGQTIYIAFRNNSNDKFVLALDDVEVSELANADSRIDSSAYPSRYTTIPVRQVMPLTLSARVLNNGGGTVTNVAVKVEVLEASNNNTVVYTGTSTPVATLAAGAKTGMLSPATSYTPADTGVFIVRYIVQMTEAQGSTVGDTVVYPLIVTDSLYSRDYLIFTENGLGALSIGDTVNNKVLGQIFEVQKSAVVVDAEFALLAPEVGDTFRVVVHAVAGNGQPTTRIGQTAVYTITPADTVGPGKFYKLAFTSPVPVAAGSKFFVGLTESKEGAISLATSPAIFSSNQHIINYNGWAPIDQFPAQFHRAFVLRPNLGKQCHTLTTSSTNATCGQANGSATVTPQGGSGGNYTYTWSVAGSTNTINNVASGTYLVTVSDGDGCDITASVDVNSTGGPSITSTSKTDVNCFGQSTGTAVVVATGNGLTYTWSTTPAQTDDTARNLAAGQYTVTVKDNQNCITTTTVTVTQPASAVSGTATKVADVNCFGATTGKAVAVGAGGTGPYTYAWSSTPAQNTDSLLAVGAGNYTVTITDSKGCTNTLGAVIAQPASAVTVTIVNKTDANQGQSNGVAVASTTGGSNPYTYSWPGSAVTGNTVNTLAAGNYTVTVTDSKGCTGTATFTIGTISSIGEDNATFSALNVFPVPASTTVTIKADLRNSEAVTIQMADITGKVVYTSNEAAAINHNINVNVTKFAKGVYTLSVKAKSGVAYQQVIVE